MKRKRALLESNLPRKNLIQRRWASNDKLKPLPDSERFLKPGLTFEELDKIAYNITENEAAERMNKARNLLFEKFNEQENHTFRRTVR